MPVLWYIISLSHTVKVIDLVSLNIKYLLWEGTVLYPHTKTLCHAIESNNKNHCSKNTFLTLKHRWLLHGQYSKCVLVILRVFKSNSFELYAVWWSYKQHHIYIYIITYCYVSGVLKENFSLPFLSLSLFPTLVLSQVEDSWSVQVTSWQSYFSHWNTSATCLFSQFEFLQPKTFSEKGMCSAQLKFITYHEHKQHNRLKNGT